LRTQPAPRDRARMRYKKRLAALMLAFALVGGLAPTAATARANPPDYQIRMADPNGLLACVWANGTRTGSAVHTNRIVLHTGLTGPGRNRCNHGAYDLWEFRRVGTLNGTPIHHLHFPRANNKCLAIAGTPRPGEDVRLEPCSSGNDDNWYVWGKTPGGLFRLRNSDPRYVDHCLQVDPSNGVRARNVQIATCGGNGQLTRRVRIQQQ
jgi:hypothetical protein